ncbi:MAG TPA: glycosyltransferase family 39 protein, partial [Polyangiaceae bacterium]|nr:glycosyltransferase family 39 protein [Polyangiaceae bacterium]
SVLIGSPAFTHGRTAYQEIAATLVQHGVYGYQPHAPTAFRPPTYPLFLALHMLAFGQHWVLAAKLSQALLLVSTGLLLIRILARLTGNGRVMVIGAVLYVGLLPLHAQLLDKNELVLFALLLAGIVNLLLASERSTLGVAALGILSGLAHLTRPTGALIAIAVIATLLYESRQQRSGKRLRRIALCLALCGATVLPWQIRNERVFGVWTLASSSTTWLNLLKGNNPIYTQHFPFVNPDLFDPYLAEDRSLFLGNPQHKVEFRYDPQIREAALQGVFAEPWHTLGWAAVKAAAFVSPLSIPLGSAEVVRRAERVSIENFRPVNPLSQLIYALYTGLAYLGIVAAWRDRKRLSTTQRTAYVFIAVFGGLLVAAHAISYPLTRYRLPLDLLLLIPSALWLQTKLPR